MQSSNMNSMPAPAQAMPKPRPPPPPHPSPLPARRRGRPRKEPVAPPPVIEAIHAEPSIEPQAQRQPPSSSTSPLLANVLTGHDTVQHHTPPTTVLPSPTPSEDNMRNAHASCLPSNLDFCDLSQGRVDYTTATSLSDGSVASVILPGRTRPRRPAEEEAGDYQEKRRCFRNDGQAQLSTTTSATIQSPITLPQNFPSPHLEQLRNSNPSSRRNSNDPVHSPQLAQAIQAHQANRNSPQSHFPAGPQRRQSWGIALASNNAPLELGTPHLRSVTGQLPQQVQVQSSWYTTQECLHILNAFQNPTASASFCQMDRVRLGVLREATTTEDWSYLIMHQLFCLLDANSGFVPANIRDLMNLNTARQVMQGVLGCNSTLSQPAFHFFANYPYNLQDIRDRWPVNFERQMSTFTSFVSQAHNYDSLRIDCVRRRFPPLAWELGRFLGIQSTRFQQFMFTAVLRYLWKDIPQDYHQQHYEARITSLFHMNQADFRSRRALEARAHSSETEVNQGNQIETRVWGPQLRQVVDDLELSLRQQDWQRPRQRAFPSRHTPPNSQLVPSNSSMPRRQPATQSRPAPRIAQQSNARRPQHVQSALNMSVLPSQSPVQQQRTVVPLLPRPGFHLGPQREPNPARFSLHQAHLRSPVLKARLLEEPLYHYVKAFIKPPTRLSRANQAVEKWTFSLPTQIARCIPEAVPGEPGEVDRRLIDTESGTIRLRCIKWAASDLPDNHIWASTDTSWIPYSYFILNGVSLQQRRKIHHGKDLSIDITGLMKEGENVLEVTVMAHSPADTSFLNYVVAIEHLGIMSQSSVKQHCLENNYMAGDQVLRDIQKKLLGGCEDDDIAIVESNLTVNLFDPFSASKMCDMPVRGRTCLHNECFDLETFLSTRRRTGDVSVHDQWRCPICKGDARPHHLMFDGFIADVKKFLDSQGLSNTRAIVVSQDGWSAKAEVRDPNGVSDRSASCEASTRQEASPPAVTRPIVPAEVIDLSD
jgi:hypothetical protein